MYKCIPMCVCNVYNLFNMFSTEAFDGRYVLEITKRKSKTEKV